MLVIILEGVNQNHPTPMRAAGLRNRSEKSTDGLGAPEPLTMHAGRGLEWVRMVQLLWKTIQQKLVGGCLQRHYSETPQTTLISTS